MFEAKVSLFDPLAFKTAPLRRIAQYWLNKATVEHLPGRTDIRPEELRQDLPYLYLVDVMRDPLGFRFRLVGTKVSQWTGRDFTGVKVEAVEYGPEWARIFADYKQVLDTRMPHRAELTAPWIDREFWYYERLLAALASDGRTIDMLLGALHVVEKPQP